MQRSILACLTVTVALCLACGGGASSARTATPGSSACGGASTASTGSCGGAGEVQTPGSGTTPAVLESFDGIPQQREVLGSADATVTIELYENFLCPHCRDFAVDLLPRLVADYVRPGSVAIRFHDVALGPPAAQLAHEAGQCAADQGKFWPAYAALYANFSDDESAYTNANIESWLAAAGLDRAALHACLTSGTHAADVRASTAAFQQLANVDPAYGNVLATVEAAQGPAIPLVDIQGTYITAPESYDEVRSAIDAKLAP